MSDRLFQLHLSACALLLGIFSEVSAEKAITLPTTPVHSAEEQEKLFRFGESGYRIELVASEPMVQDPVMIRFDGRGRLWVVEMRGYMQNIDGKSSDEPIGRISVLTDNDRDGKMDESTIFLDGLVLPRSIAILPDSILVAENKPLWFVRDTDGDLIADEKILIDKNYAKDNIEHSANGLYRAMDNWFYSAKEGHRYRRVAGEWIREKTEARGQWGICQDNYGRLFYNYNHSQLFADIVPPNSFTRNPNHETTTGWNLSVEPTNRVFPIRANPATNRGYLPGALDESGSIQQFTSACAPFIYREALFPEFAGDAFVCETAGNLVKRNLLSYGDAFVVGSLAYSDREFLASTDERFRPCWIETGPDGALYLADMYRGIVQDAPHMSPYLRQISLDREMVHPIHLGRIWRVVPEDFSQPKAPNFAELTTEELVALLDHESGWWRDQAQSHLVESRRKDSIPRLIEKLKTGERELGRLHALWTLEGLSIENGKALTFALSDPSPAVRSAALRVLSGMGYAPTHLASKIEEQTGPKNLLEEVLQGVLTLGDLEISSRERHTILTEIMLHRAGEAVLRDATMSSLSGEEIEFLTLAWDRLDGNGPVQAGWDVLIESLTMAGLRGRNPSANSGLLAKLESDGSINWKQESLLSGIEALRNHLTAEPLPLSEKPIAAATEPGLANYFSWPGHTPLRPKLAKGTKALKKSERERFARGRQIYLTSCIACHDSDGAGMKYLAPPLAASDWVTGDDDRLIRVLLHGLSGPITVSGKHYAAPEVQSMMPPLAGLGNADIAAVLTYIRREWGNAASPISSGRVSKVRIATQGRTVPWTEAELKQASATEE